MANLLDRTKLAILMAASLSIGLVTGLPARCQGQPQTQPIDAPLCKSVLRTDQGQLRALYLSSDDRTLLTCGLDGSAMTWDVATGARQHFIKPESKGDSTKIWDVMSASQKRLVVEQPGKAERTTYSFAPDSSHVIIIKHGENVQQNGVYVYNLYNGHKRRIYDGAKTDHRSTGLSGLPETFPLGSERNQLAYCVRTYHRQPPNISFISFRILIDDLKEEAPVVNISDDLGFMYTGHAFSDDGRMFCTVCQQRNARKASLPVGRVALWDPRTGEMIARVDTRGRSVVFPRFSPNGRDLAILGGSAPNLIYICSTTEMDVQRTLTDYAKKPGCGQMPLSNLFYTPDGSYLTAYGTGGTIMFWETKEYREVLWMKLYPKDTLQWVWFSRDGRMLTTGGKKDEWDTVKFWDLDQFRPLMRGKKAGPGAAPPR